MYCWMVEQFHGIEYEFICNALSQNRHLIFLIMDYAFDHRGIVLLNQIREWTRRVPIDQSRRAFIPLLWVHKIHKNQLFSKPELVTWSLTSIACEIFSIKFPEKRMRDRKNYNMKKCSECDRWTYCRSKSDEIVFCSKCDKTKTKTDDAWPTIQYLCALPCFLEMARHDGTFVSQVLDVIDHIK